MLIKIRENSHNEGVEAARLQPRKPLKHYPQQSLASPEAPQQSTILTSPSNNPTFSEKSTLEKGLSYLIGEVKSSSPSSNYPLAYQTSFNTKYSNINNLFISVQPLQGGYKEAI